MRDKGANPDQVLARIASCQHGVVSAIQLRAAGLDPQGIYRRARGGRLHRLHRGVYAVGHTKLSFDGHCMAATLALGAGAVISHQSAATVWGMLKPTSGPIHVTLPGDAGRKRRRGIEIHRSHSLTDGVTTRHNGIAVTKPGRTLRDLRRNLRQPAYQRAVRRALDLRLISSAQLRHDDDLTRSELERLFRSLCHRHRLPTPEVNAQVGPYEVDFVWRDRAVIAEVDGFRYHAHRDAFESDRARDAALQSLGLRVLRFTHRQLTHERPAVVATLRALLGQSPLPPNL
jgi:very-short-patch-repair endonuclease